MGAQDSKHGYPPGMDGKFYDYAGEANTSGDHKNAGMMSKLAQAIGYGGNSSTGGTGIVSAQDSLVTGEGTQPLSDMNWKKRENKYLGANSITDKEAKEQKELDKSKKIDQYLSKFPDNEKYLGFENVSTAFNFNIFLVGKDSNICYANSAI